MLSRVADTIYWMNRYLERAENITRFVEVHLNLSLDLPQGLQEQWEPLISSSGDIDQFEKLHGKNYSRQTVIPFLIFDQRNPNAILSCLAKARENARTVRERISTEMWRQINHLYLLINDSKSREIWNLEEWFLFLESVRQGCYGIAGMAHHTLSRSEEWKMAKLGRHLERADQLTRILNVKYDELASGSNSTATTLDLIQWGAVLRSISGYEMYQREHRILSPKKIAAFLILNSDFPRSLRYNIIQFQEALHAVTGNPVGTFFLPLEKQIGQLKSNLDYTDELDITKEGVHQYLDKMQDKLYEIGQLLNTYFFGISN